MPPSLCIATEPDKNSVAGETPVPKMMRSASTSFPEASRTLFAFPYESAMTAFTDSFGKMLIPFSSCYLANMAPISLPMTLSNGNSVF